MGTLSDFLRVLRFTSLCFVILAGLVYLVFDTPWQLSFALLSAVLIAGLIWLNPSPLFPRSCQNPLIQEMEDPPQIDSVLSYRGTKYTTHPGMDLNGETTLSSDTGQDAGDVIGKYRGSVIRRPHIHNG